MHEVGDSTGSDGKHKNLLPDFTEDEINNVILSITDSEEENDSKKMCRSNVTTLRGNGISIRKPQLPTSWTRAVSTFDKGKSLDISSKQ